MTFNELLTKIGVDKVLHFAVGGLITALFTLPIVLQESKIDISILSVPLIGTIVTAVLSVFKELIVDTEFSLKDVIASVLGSIPVWIIIILYVLFNAI